MYKKAQFVNNQKDQIYQLKPLLIGIEFDTKKYDTFEKIKQWFVENYKKFGYAFDFKNKELILIDKENEITAL